MVNISTFYSDINLNHFFPFPNSTVPKPGVSGRRRQISPRGIATGAASKALFVRSRKDVIYSAFTANCTPRFRKRYDIPLVGNG
ncbi:hypothetical protein JTE90_017899 [Oedothorax gibbosus]|uniref:Uncharacterized protein n=1 Tax=Oedothorax gibbosus TaxID=931172 RepID=A0AAV6VIX0_9ARAC|nr:hypothetical protein JTE90_017899 [Oedothorax gibbosus]